MIRVMLFFFSFRFPSALAARATGIVRIVFCEWRSKKKKPSGDIITCVFIRALGMEFQTSRVVVHPPKTRRSQCARFGVRTVTEAIARARCRNAPVFARVVCARSYTYVFQCLRMQTIVRFPYQPVRSRAKTESKTVR